MVNNTQLENRCDDLAKMYPFSSRTIYDLYLTIDRYEKDKKLVESTEDKKFDILTRVIETAAIHAINPFTILYIVYSDEVKELFTR